MGRIFDDNGNRISYSSNFAGGRIARSGRLEEEPESVFSRFISGVQMAGRFGKEMLKEGGRAIGRVALTIGDRPNLIETLSGREKEPLKPVNLFGEEIKSMRRVAKDESDKYERGEISRKTFLKHMVGNFGEQVVDVATLFSLPAKSATAIKTGIKGELKTAVKSGAKIGAKFGGAYGFSEALKRDETFPDILRSTAMGTAMGAGLGAGLGTGGVFMGKAFGKAFGKSRLKGTFVDKLRKEEKKPTTIADITQRGEREKEKKFIGLTKEDSKTSAPWRIEYEEYGGERHAMHETSKKKAIEYIKDKFGIDIRHSTLRPKLKRKGFLSVKPKKVDIEKIIRESGVNYKIVKRKAVSELEGKAKGRARYDFKRKRGIIEVAEDASDTTKAHEFGHVANFTLGEGKDKFTNQLTKFVNKQTEEVPKAIVNYIRKKLGKGVTEKDIQRHSVKLVDDMLKNIKQAARVDKADFKFKNLSEEFATAVSNAVMKQQKTSRVAPNWVKFVNSEILHGKTTKRAITTIKPFEAKAYRGMVSGKADKELGEYYSIDKKTAEFYKDYKTRKTGLAGKVIEKTIRLENPLYIKGEPGFGAFNEMVRKIPKLKGVLKKMRSREISDLEMDNAIVRGEKLIKNYAKQKGHDGIVFAGGETIIKVSKKPKAKVSTKETMIPIFRGQKGKLLTGKIRGIKTRGYPTGIGTSFTTDKKIAKVYGYKGNVIKRYIKKDDILRYKDLDRETQKYIKSIIDERIDKVREGIENDNFKPFEELVTELGEIARIKNKKAIDISSFNIPSEAEIRVISNKGLREIPTAKYEVEKGLKNTAKELGIDKYVSDETILWLDDYLQGVDMGVKLKPMPPQLLIELSKYKPNKPVKLYRGIRKDQKTSKLGFESWSYSKEIAKGFGGKVISREISPNEIIVDFSKMPKILRRNILHGFQENVEKEVLVRTTKPIQAVKEVKETKPPEIIEKITKKVMLPETKAEKAGRLAERIKAMGKRRKLIKDQRLFREIAGETEMEIVERIAKAEAKKEVGGMKQEHAGLKKAIQMSEHFRKERTMLDNWRNATLYYQKFGDMYRLAWTDKQKRGLLKAGYHSVMGVDEIASEAGYKDTYKFLEEFVDELNDKNKFSEPEKIAHDWLIEHNDEYAKLDSDIQSLTERIDKLKKPHGKVKTITKTIKRKEAPPARAEKPAIKKGVRKASLKPVKPKNIPKKFIPRGKDITKYDEKINTSEDVANLVTKLSESDKINRDIQKRGIVTWAETEKEANAMGVSFEAIKKQSTSSRQFAAKMEAIKQLRANKASELHDFLSGMPRNPTDAQKAKIAQRIEEFLFIDRNLKSMGTEHGRAVNILKKEVIPEEYELYNDLIDKIIKINPKKYSSQLDYVKQVDKVVDPKGNILMNAANVPRSLMATGEFSAMLRQGVFVAARHPIRFLGAGKTMLQSMSEKGYGKMMNEIQSRPTYELMKVTKLAIMDLGEDLTRREEAIMSSLPERIPLFGKWYIKPTNRAYTAFLNKLRADLFDDMVKGMDNVGIRDEAAFKSLANYINSATGRGDLGKYAKHAEILNATIFSPRLVKSRIDLLNPYYYYKLHPYVRKEALKTLFTFVGMGATILGLAKMNGCEVGDDPRSADFGKIKIGKTRFDIWGGFQQYAVLAARLITNEMVSSTTGKEFALGEGYKPTTRASIIRRFFEYKTSPIASFALGMAEGKTAIGEDFNVPEEIVNRLYPMIYQDVYDLMREGKSPMGALPAVFGVGVQTYGNRIPMEVKDAKGRKKIKWEYPPSLGEAIINLAIGKKVSNIPKSRWASLQRKEERRRNLEAQLSNIKRRVLETGKTERFRGQTIFLRNGVVRTRGKFRK